MHTLTLSVFARHPSLSWTLFLGLSLLLPARAAAAEGRTGEQIYRQMCASCHGEMGEGTEENYPHRLQGDRSVAGLTRLISRTMPKDDPGTCTGPDAEKVASYIYDTFYSEVARARNKPPRVELSRLTVRQYRNAVADLVGTFRTAGHWNGERGLKGEYFKSRRIANFDRALERLDPEVRFDFGTDGPDESFDPAVFSIRWTGSVLAPETGTYEFVVRTEHAARLWVNDPNRPLIDAWVKSGNDTEYRGSIFLLGGRAYPLRLEFSKAKQGVDDSKKNKTKPPPVKASVALLWKLPHRADEVIPARNLSPAAFPELFVLETSFPPDDRSMGFERGTSVSKAWDQATTDAAIEVAGYVAAHLRELAGVRDDAADRPARLRDFCRRFAERAFRRPLTAEEQRLFVEHQFEAAPDPDVAVKRVVLLVLEAPQFLYPDLGGPEPYRVASRLSFGLWDSLPDQELLDAAAAGKLATREQVTAQAERMLTDLRARSKVREFLLQWLKVEQVPDVSKDPRRYPGFDQAIFSDLRTSLDLFLEDVVWGESSDFRQLFLADSLYLNGRLAQFYGADLPEDAPFQKVYLDPGVRAGILTHPYLLTTFAYTDTTSPIHRGVFLARNVLGQMLRPPPQAFTPLPAGAHPELTTRERVALQTKPEACQTCHNMINPLGFTLENFDAVGRFRDTENGRPIDARGMYQTRTGELVKFAGVRDLATFLAGSDEAHDSFVEHLFHYLVKQPVRAYGPRASAELREAFARNDFSVRRLMVEMMAVSALPPREEKP